jgi:hypothetical protein
MKPISDDMECVVEFVGKLAMKAISDDITTTTVSIPARAARNASLSYVGNVAMAAHLQY